MKRARVAWMGAVHDAAEVDGRLQLADGRVVDEASVVWLPPLQPTDRPRTIFALGSELRGPRQGTRLQGAGRAADLPQGHELAGRPPRPDAPAGGRDVHALRMRTRGGDRPDRAPRDPRGRVRLRRRIHGGQRLCDPRLSRELLPPELSREKPGRVHADRAVAGRRRRREASDEPAHDHDGQRHGDATGQHRRHGVRHRRS